VHLADTAACVDRGSRRRAVRAKAKRKERRIMFFKRKRNNAISAVEAPRKAPAPSPIDLKNVTVLDWLRARIQEEPYWFLKMELPGGLVTPGWSDPRVDKLPHYGLPADMKGMRVLDIGHAEGFFSFEAERR
jgi:hypothetical protein